METRPIVKHLRTDISGRTLEGLSGNTSGVTELDFGEIAVNYNIDTPMLMIKTSGTSGIGVTEFYDKSHIIELKGTVGGIQDDIIDIEYQLNQIIVSGTSVNIIASDGIHVAKSGINNTISVTIDDGPNNDGYIYSNMSGVGISGLTSKIENEVNKVTVNSKGQDVNNNIDIYANDIQISSGDVTTVSELIDDINTTIGSGFSTANTITSALENLMDTTIVSTGDTILTQTISGGLKSEINLVKLSNPSPEYASSYQLQGVNGVPIGANINIPMDQFLDSASFFPVLGSVEKNAAINASNSGVSVSPTPSTLDISKSYIKFIFNTTAGSEWLYLDVSTLVNIYTAGYGIVMSGETNNIITVDTNVVATKSAVTAIEEVFPISAFTNVSGAYYGQTVAIIFGDIFSEISTINQIITNINDDVRRTVNVYSDLFDLSGLTLGSKIYVVNDENVALTPYKSGLYICAQITPSLIFKKLLYEDDYANVNIIGGFGISSNTVNDTITVGLTDLYFSSNTTSPKISIDVGTF